MSTLVNIFILILSCSNVKPEVPSSNITIIVQQVNFFEDFNNKQLVNSKWAKKLDNNFFLKEDKTDSGDFSLNFDRGNFITSELNKELLPRLSKKVTLGYDFKFTESPLYTRYLWDFTVGLYPKLIAKEEGLVKEQEGQCLKIQLASYMGEHVSMFIRLMLKNGLELKWSLQESAHKVDPVLGRPEREFHPIMFNGGAQKVLDNLVNDQEWHNIEFSLFENDTFQLLLDAQEFRSGNIFDYFALNETMSKLLYFKKKNMFGYMPDVTDIGVYVQTYFTDANLLLDNVYVTSEIECEDDQYDFDDPCYIKNRSKKITLSILISMIVIIIFIYSF